MAPSLDGAISVSRYDVIMSSERAAPVERVTAPRADPRTDPRAGSGASGRILPRPAASARWIAVGVAILVQLPGLATADAGTDVRLFLVLAAASSFLLLASHRYSGLVVALLAVLGVPALSFGEGATFSVAPLLIAVVLAVFDGRRVWVWGSIAGLALVGPAMVILERPVADRFDLPVSVSRPLATVLALSILVGIAEVLRARREAAVERAVREVRRQREQAESERLRIARELHDILAHALSQISVQAGVGLRLFDERPESARAALAAIKDTGSRSLDELRGVLGFLRDEDDRPLRPAGPDLTALPALVASFASSPLRVGTQIDSTVTLSAAESQAAYRVVQEALTNVARHAGAARARVVLTVGTSGAPVLSIRDDGHGAGGAVHEGSGIIGMRERALLVGADLTAGPGPDGGFLVEMRMPPRADASAATGR